MKFFNSHADHPLKSATDALLAVLLWGCCLAAGATRGLAAEGPEIEYERDVAPIFRQFCAGCHNDGVRDGEFSLESYRALMTGLEDGPAVLPGEVEGSRIWRVMTGREEPAMPPEGEPAPSPEQLAVIENWIRQGAGGPQGMAPDRLTIHVPRIASRTELSPITSLAYSPDGGQLAVARYGQVTIQQMADGQPGQAELTLTGLPGKVSALHFSRDGRSLVTASGVTGSGGLAVLWDAVTGERLRDFAGHRDILYDAELSPNGALLATCSYDHQILLWEVATGKLLRTLSGHNGAVYALAFRPDGNVLASASADETCKLWRVRDGERLDTLGQPLKEVTAVLFSVDGQQVIAGGADHRIRAWKLLSQERPRINPQLFARFAHEAPIVQMVLSPDGSRLVTAAEDRTIKVWETRNFTEVQSIENQPDVAMALAVSPDGSRIAVGRLDGSWEQLTLSPVQRTSTRQSVAAGGSPQIPREAPAEIAETAEAEPNDLPQQAQPITLPTRITGVIHSGGEQPDADCFRMTVQQGEQWVFEVNAAQSESPLDSYIEILTPDGMPVERVKLQAVLDSYFTFRGKDGLQADDFRVFNWEEMRLNQLLYSNGEVVKLWRAPRGPDSGFVVYSGGNNRWTYYDTMALSHALNEPCYIVEPHAPDEELIPNGLPVFTIFYENDDDSSRVLGKDSKLFFTAPADGEYVLRLRDVRGMQGTDFTYALTVRPVQQDFAVTPRNRNVALVPGAAGEVLLTVDRIDRFAGPVEFSLSDLPEGIRMLAPIQVEAEQSQVQAVLVVAEGAPLPTPEQVKQIRLTAAGMIEGQMVKHVSRPFRSIKFQDRLPFSAAIVAAEGGAVPIAGGDGAPLEFELHPGETIMVKVVLDRENTDQEINFANNNSEEAGRNVPHGVIVDNLGLNGLMIPAGSNEQKVFFSAANEVRPQSRPVTLKFRGTPQVVGPIILHVRPREQAAGHP